MTDSLVSLGISKTSNGVLSSLNSFILAPALIMASGRLFLSCLIVFFVDSVLSEGCRWTQFQLGRKNEESVLLLTKMVRIIWCPVAYNFPFYLPNATCNLIMEMPSFAGRTLSFWMLERKEGAPFPSGGVHGGTGRLKSFEHSYVWLPLKPLCFGVICRPMLSISSTLWHYTSRFATSHRYAKWRTICILMSYRLGQHVFQLRFSFNSDSGSLIERD